MKKPLAVAKIDAEMSLIPVRAHILCSMTNAVSSVPCHQHCLLSKVRARPLCVRQLQAQPAQPAAGLAQPSSAMARAPVRACFDSVNNLKEDQIETLKQIFSARASAQGYGDGYQCIKRKQSVAFTIRILLTFLNYFFWLHCLLFQISQMLCYNKAVTK